MTARKRILIASIALCALVAVVVIYAFDPSCTWWSPKCPMLLLTGYRCPACGFQRFCHHLLHGDVLTAVSYNYFLLLALPWIIILLLANILPQTPIVRRIQSLFGGRQAAIIYLVLYVAWWVVRNVWEL